ncbi:adenylate/guanylate cyclase domain-containing protein [Breoghania sp. L-A4]|uniref:adenylate/guanylate cyclase domain-containing protein n=1 Tax=Breoghania sp. L-A4 TaxID=2304600 RepID=UPI000E35CB16|nr:adenylate/guanylate cyclase domain-containing protein [Breoghania sp. L-A4]AXS41271.1 adenylate/guanylate cyclase domain-containing protein [Breoghania sp. L-A4]
MVARDRDRPADEPTDEPFPLRRHFRRRFVPAFVVFIAVFLFLVALSAWSVAEHIYLELAERRAETIARAVAEQTPEGWENLMRGRRVAGADDGLEEAFRAEVREHQFSDLKVYDLDRKVLFSTNAAQINTIEEGAALHRVIEDGEPLVDSAIAADGSTQFELYVPLHDDLGALRAVFELYEPVGYLNGIVLRAGAITVVVPGVLLLVLALALGHLVRAAQSDIDARNRALIELRRQLETFVSGSAVSAARKAKGEGPIASEKIVTTLLYSDIRRFTDYAETHTPEEVVAFLNEIMSVQVAAVAEHGGDVDKMIGDALLARFDGGEGAAHAVAAAREILRVVAKGGYPRKLGIGVYRGEVILGSIGPAARKDFTVIGDSVNMSARLCSAASEGELVVDAALADDGFGPPETLRVKGHREPLTVRRWKV